MRSLPLLSLVLLLAACDKVDSPIEPGSGTPNPSGSTTHKVLLEEYTGHLCTTCPAAHAVAAQLQAQFGDRLIIVAEHVGSLAQPDNVSHPGYTTDFRTPAGNAYFQRWPSDVIPRGLIDRTPYNGNVVLSKDNWADAIQQRIALDATMRIEFTGLTYTSGTHQVHVTVRCTPLADIDHDMSLVVQLLEDHVIDRQLDADHNPPDIPDYDHRHVLRDNLNGTWGEPLITGSAMANSTIEKTYDYTLSANVVDPNKCLLVAYAMDAPGTTTEYQVQQVEEVKLVP